MKRTKYYHTDEVAKILKLSANEVRAMLVSKELKGFKRGRRWFINMDQPALEKAKVEHTPSNPPTFIHYIKDADHENAIYQNLCETMHSVYITTYNFRDVYFRGKSLISILNELSDDGIDVKVICADLYTKKEKSFDFSICPRNHTKLFIFDEELVYIGSANLSRTALNDRSDKDKGISNHEAGILTNDSSIVKQALQHFHHIQKKENCRTCKMKDCKYRKRRR